MTASLAKAPPEHTHEVVDEEADGKLLARPIVVLQLCSSRFMHVNI